jgi:hypothetical protein
MKLNIVSLIRTLQRNPLIWLLLFMGSSQIGVDAKEELCLIKENPL